MDSADLSLSILSCPRLDDVQKKKIRVQKLISKVDEQHHVPKKFFLFNLVCFRNSRASEYILIK